MERQQMSGVLRFMSIAGAAVLIFLIIVTIISLFGGMTHPLSNPPT
jgi:amino acid transporter